MSEKTTVAGTCLSGLKRAFKRSSLLSGTSAVPVLVSFFPDLGFEGFPDFRESSSNKVVFPVLGNPINPARNISNGPRTVKG